MIVDRQKRFAVMLAVIGFVITAVLFAYIELTDYGPMNPVLLWISFLLCPASLLSVLLFDLSPHSVDMTIAWLIIGLFNAGLYAAVGKVIGKAQDAGLKPGATKAQDRSTRA